MRTPERILIHLDHDASLSVGDIVDRRSLSLTLMALFSVAATAVALAADARAEAVVDLRGRAEQLHLLGPPSGFPVVVSSGDGGWIHLGPHAAQVLATHGYRIVGFDVRAYLSSFTSGDSTLDASLVPADYARLVQLAGAGTHERPVLVGVSEGAGLSVLAAANRTVRDSISGVVGLGMPDETELGWHWRDAIIYLTHGAPREPFFRTSGVIEHVSPLPVADIHATHDEYVPLTEAEAVLRRAAEPKRLWVVPASDHRFSDNQEEFDRRLLEAVAWARSQAVVRTAETR